MVFGLDIGTAAIRVATGTADDPSIESIPAIVLPVDDAALEAADVSPADLAIVERDGTRYVVGADARAVAEAVDEEPEVPFADGLVSPEPFAEPAFDALVERALEATAAETEDDRLSYTTPGSVIGAASASEDHRRAVARVLEGADVEATPIGAGFAVVYDQLGDNNYTGLGVRLGRQSTSVALAYYGVPVLSFTLPRGRDWIVERAAGETGHAKSQVEGVLEGFALDPDAATGGVERALAGGYDAIAEALADAIREEADGSDVRDGIAVPVAVAGSGAIEGVEYLVGGRLDGANLPFSIRGVRLADEPSHSAARGALRAAADDVDGYEAVVWSASSLETGPDRDDAATDGNVPARDADDSERATLSFDEGRLADGTNGGGDDDLANAAIDQLFDRLATRDDEIETVGETVEALRADLEALEDRAATASALEDLESDLETLSDDLADLEEASEAFATGEDLAALEGALVSDLEAAVDALEGSVAAVDDDLAALEETVSAVDESVSTVEETAADERESLASSIEDAEDAIEALDDGLSAVETQGSTLETRLEERTNAVESRFDDVRADLDELETATADDVDALRAAVADLEGRLESTAEVVEGVEDDLESVDGSVESQGDALDRLEETVDDQGTRLEAVSGRFEEQSARISSVSGRLEELDAATASAADLAAIDETVEDVRETVEAVEADVESSRSDLASLESDVERLDGDVSDVDRALEEVNEAVTAVVDDVESLADDAASTADLGALESTVDGLDDDVRSLEEAAGDLEERLAERTATLEESFDDRATTLEEQQDERTSDVESRLDGRLSDVETDLAETRDELETVRRRVDSRADGEDESDGRAGTDLVPSIASGAGGAGVVAGGVTALTGEALIGVGAVVLGVILLAIPFLVAR
ncbi:chromosome segregation ATPase [Natrialbaceae archaeon GCM10025810]|uniref:chromosome segregation ATPase n=1 Tax=Halovalidus salilacus TaxID=3075124 RepID=UPI00360AC72D